MAYPFAFYNKTNEWKVEGYPSFETILNDEHAPQKTLRFIRKVKQGSNLYHRDAKKYSIKLYKGFLRTNDITILLSDLVMLYTGRDGWRGSPIWKPIWFQDITKLNIEENKIEITTKIKLQNGDENKEFTFLPNDLDEWKEFKTDICTKISNISNNDREGILKDSLQKPVCAAGGRWRKTKRAKKNKRRTRRS